MNAFFRRGGGFTWRSFSWLLPRTLRTIATPSAAALWASGNHQHDEHDDQPAQNAKTIVQKVAWLVYARKLRRWCAVCGPLGPPGRAWYILASDV